MGFADLADELEQLSQRLLALRGHL